MGEIACPTWYIPYHDVGDDVTKAPATGTRDFGPLPLGGTYLPYRSGLPQMLVGFYTI
jgi:hypothetical protein